MPPVSFLWRTVGPACHDEQVKLHLQPDQTVARCAHLRNRDERPFAYEITSIPLDRLPPVDIASLHEVRALADSGIVTLGLATESIAEVAADRIVAARLEVDEGQPLLRLERTIQSSAGVPIEWRVSYLVK